MNLVLSVFFAVVGMLTVFMAVGNFSSRKHMLQMSEDTANKSKELKDSGLDKEAEQFAKLSSGFKSLARHSVLLTVMGLVLGVLAFLLAIDFFVNRTS